MADIVDNDLMGFAIHFVDDAIFPHPYTIEPLGICQLDCLTRERMFSQCFDLSDDPCYKLLR